MSLMLQTRLFKLLQAALPNFEAEATLILSPILKKKVKKIASFVNPLPHPAGSGAQRRWSQKQVNRPIPTLIHAAAAQPRMQPLSEVPFQR